MNFTAILLVANLLVEQSGVLPTNADSQRADPAAEGRQTEERNPSDIVRRAAQNVLEQLDAHRDAYRADPAKLEQLIDQYLMPHFDINYAARLVLGRYWRSSSSAQHQRFIRAFHRWLLSTYGNLLIDYTANNMQVFPTRVNPGATRATVRAQVKRDNGDRVAVNFYVHRTPEGWKAWDVAVDGVSYARSYRQDFGAQIEKEGFDAVIERLKRGSLGAPLANPSSSEAS